MGAHQAAKLDADPVIWFVDDYKKMLKRAVDFLNRAGFPSVVPMFSAAQVFERFKTERPDLLIQDIGLGDNQPDGIHVVRRLRSMGFDGRVLMFTGDAVPDTVLRAALAGADDYFVKGKNLDVLIAQTRRLLGDTPITTADLDRHEAFREGAYVRSLGLSEWNLDLLTEICRGLPRLVDVAERLGRSPQQVNQAVSRIYKKLHLEHYGQLMHLLAILEMFSRRVTDDWE